MGRSNPNTAYSDGDFVKYYVCATDNDNLSACLPDVPNDFDPQFFFVRDGGTQIYDVQYAPSFGNGNSGYNGFTVSVSGIVTSTSNSDDLGFVYIQQPGEDKFAGLSIVGSTDLNNLDRGDMVEVTGEIEENFGFTRMQVTNVNVMTTGNAVPDPVEVLADSFTSYSLTQTEPYESMLVTLTSEMIRFM